MSFPHLCFDSRFLCTTETQPSTERATDQPTDVQHASNPETHSAARVSVTERGICRFPSLSQGAPHCPAAPRATCHQMEQEE